MTDHDLISQYLRDPSTDAFDQLVNRHIHWLHCAALRRAHDPALAQDIVQAVFLILAQKTPSPDKPLAPWLFRVLQYVAANALRAQSRREFHERQAAVMHSTKPTEPAWSDLAPHLETALEKLSPPDRDAILLRFYQQLTFPQIAQTLDTTEEAAQKRVDRALDRLKDILLKKSTQTLLPATLFTTLLIKNTVHAAPADLVAGVLSATPSTNALLLSKGALKIMMYDKLKWIVAACIAIGLSITLGIVLTRAAEPANKPAAVQPAPAPANNPLYNAWLNAKSKTVQYTRSELISGGAPIPGGQPQPSISQLSLTLDNLTPEKASLKITRGDATETLEILANLPKDELPKSVGKETIKIGDKTYACEKYTTTSANPAEIGRNPQGLRAQVTLWLSNDVPGGIVQRQISLTIRASYEITDTLKPD